MKIGYVDVTTTFVETAEVVEYSALGPFRPGWHSMGFVPYAKRNAHVARHTPRPRPGQLRQWAVSCWREAGEFLVGAFQPIKSAI